MRIRFFVEDDEPDVHEVPVADVREFLAVVKASHIDRDGKYYQVQSVNYDVRQNAIDVVCEDEDAG